MLSWLNENSEIIDLELEKLWLFIVQEREELISNWDLYNSQTRLYSEMPLCSILKKLSLPHDFSLSEGKVYYHDYPNGRHHKWASSADKILCFTPGQFIDEDDILTSGKRIETLTNLEDKLILLAEPNVIALYGTKQDIEESYGLSYQKN